LKYLLEAQKQIELQFTNLNNLQGGQPSQGVPSNLAGEAQYQIPTEGQNVESQVENAPSNIVTNLISLLNLKLQHLSQLLGNQQNAQQALSQCANSLNSAPSQYPSQLAMVNTLQPEFAEELQNTPNQLTMCNNMMSSLQQRIPQNMMSSFPIQELRTRFLVNRNIGNTLQGQTLNTHKNLVLQNVVQLQQAQQLN
jgi:hypothetical protein